MPVSKTLLACSVLLAMATALVGCGGEEPLDTTQIKAYAIENEPLVKEFNELFEGANHLLGANQDDNSRGTWSSDAVLAGNRYHLHMEFDAGIDVKANTLTRSGEPTFYLAKNPDPSGGTAVSGKVMSAEFGESEWKKIVAAKGNLSPVLRLLK